MKFLGYRRIDGKVGIRNNVLILPTSICASDTTRIIAQQVKGAVTFNNQNGCSQVGPDMKLTMDIMAGFAANPNIYGCVVVSLGCENCQNDLVIDEIKKLTNKPIASFIIQKEGGTIKTVENATRAAQQMVREASLLQKEEFPISELIIGTECGGSDPTSGVASNPLVGEFCDKVIANGATAILSETTEFIGAEHILVRRAKNEEVKDRIYDIIHRYESHIKTVGEDVRNGNPSPGNIAGGLTTLEEKSLGCIHKGGSTTINKVYDYAEEVKEKGLVVMDTPGNDPSSVAGMIAGGAQIVIFTTGRGTPTGNPIAPVIKITGNRETFKMMEDNLDFDASPVIYKHGCMNELRDELINEVLEVASGKPVKSEVLGYTELAIARACNYV